MKKEDIIELIPTLSKEDAQALADLWEEELLKEKETISTQFDAEKIREEAFLEARKEFFKEKKESAIEKALEEANSKSTKALAALINLDNVDFEDGKLIGLSEQIEELKRECGFLFFDEEENKPKFTKGIESFEAKPDISGLSYKERLKLFNQMPELYKKLAK